ncbi:MAG: NAD(P)H-binding protein [Gemmatimonadaceae bacterium]
MHLFVLGATGKTGGAVVDQSLARGHRVTTFGRNASRRAPAILRHDIIGNPMDATALAAALPGHDTVLSLLGTRGLGATSVLEDGARAMLAAMRRADVKRLIIVSSSLLDHDIGLLSRVVARTVLRHHSRDQRAMEALVTASEAEWTILRPPRMSQTGPPGPYALTTGSAPTGSRGMLIRTDEVARAMLDIAESRQYVREIVWLRGALA